MLDGNGAFLGSQIHQGGSAVAETPDGVLHGAFQQIYTDTTGQSQNGIAGNGYLTETISTSAKAEGITQIFADNLDVPRQLVGMAYQGQTIAMGLQLNTIVSDNSQAFNLALLIQTGTESPLYVSFYSASPSLDTTPYLVDVYAKGDHFMVGWRLNDAVNDVSEFRLTEVTMDGEVGLTYTLPANVTSLAATDQGFTATVYDAVLGKISLVELNSHGKQIGEAYTVATVSSDVGLLYSGAPHIASSGNARAVVWAEGKSEISSKGKIAFLNCE